jgi:WD40 repeat protein
LTPFERLTSMVGVTVSSTPAHGAPVCCVAFRADGARLASGSTDHTAIVWDTTDPRRPNLLTTLIHHAAVTSASWNPGAADVLATGSADGTAAVWRVVDDRPPSLMKALPGHPGAITTIAWTPDGQHLLCLIGGGQLAVWNAFDQTFLGELRDCVRVDVSPAGLVATAGTDGLISVRDLWRDARPSARRPAAVAEACAWSPSGDVLAVAGDDGSIEMFAPDLTPLRRIYPGDVPLRGLTWSADGRYLIAGGYDGSLVAMSSDRPLWRRAHGLLWPRSLAAGAGVVASATFGARPHVVDLLAGATLGFPVAPSSPSSSPSVPLAFRGGVLNADGRIVSAGAPDDRRVLWEHDTRVGALCSLGDRVVVSAAHRTIRLTVLDPDGTSRGLTLRAPEPVKTVAVLGSAELPVVVAASYDFRLYSWTLDWSALPPGPRLIGEFAYGIAALTCLDNHRLTATDHHGELAILALGADGALSA